MNKTIEVLEQAVDYYNNSMLPSSIYWHDDFPEALTTAISALKALSEAEGATDRATIRGHRHVDYNGEK